MGLSAKKLSLLGATRLGVPLLIFCCFPATIVSYEVIILEDLLCAELSARTKTVLDPVLKLNRSTNTEDGMHYVYSHENIECRASFVVRPTTLSQVQDVIRYALEYDYAVKAISAGHTASDAICTSGILLDMRGFKHFSFDPETNLATAGSGMGLSDFLEAIHKHGRGLVGVPNFGGISLGGSVGAGTHGTNLKGPATISDQVVSLTFVDGEGNVRQLREGDEDFRALRVNLGLLGIVYEVTLRTTEQYKLEMRNFPMSDEILWRGREIREMAEQYDTFQFFWYPTNKQIIVMTGTKVDVDVPGNCRTNSIPSVRLGNREGVYQSLEQMQQDGDDLGFFYAQSLVKLGLYEDVPGRAPYYTEGESVTNCLPVAVGYSHRMMTSLVPKDFHSIRYNDGAVLIDMDDMEGALRTLKEITDELLVGFPLMGMNFRFVRESDAYMGLNRNKPSLQIEWITSPRKDMTQPKLGIAAYQAIGQALVERHGARPHWGKNGLYYTTHPIIQKAYPDLPKFVDVMNRMDPHEVFINNFGKRLKHGTRDMTLFEAAKLRCALNEACLCKDDLDCGDGTPAAYVCGDFKEFKVCNRRPTPENLLRDVSNRDAMDVAAKLGDMDKVDLVMEMLAPYKGFGDMRTD